LTFYDSTGRPLIRLALDAVQLQPRSRLRFEIIGEQHFYGLGEGGQQFDRLGVARRLWNFQANHGQGADIAIPLLLSQAGYALFIDNSAAATLEPADVYDGTWIDYVSEAGPLDVYLIVGGMCARYWVGSLICSVMLRCLRVGRWATCNPPDISMAPRRFAL
jgi:alpha-glucosidase (family GH31 glycosyl hydrolase)